ncbi:MAG: heavy-metal-associated domain-containing protein [Edaphobacter sp.]
MRDTLTLTIQGMHCGGCVHRVTNALQGIKGIELETVEVGSARMTVDSVQTSVEEIVAAVDRIGFSAQVEKS